MRILADLEILNLPLFTVAAATVRSRRLRRSGLASARKTSAWSVRGTSPSDRSFLDVLLEAIASNVPETDPSCGLEALVVLIRGPSGQHDHLNAK